MTDIDYHTYDDLEHVFQILTKNFPAFGTFSGLQYCPDYVSHGHLSFDPHEII